MRLFARLSSIDNCQRHLLSFDALLPYAEASWQGTLSEVF